MRVILGGTFDPVHLGHIQVANDLATKLNEPVYLMPCYHAVHKQQGSSSHHRLNMLRLAIQGNASLILDKREIQRASPSYSIDSILELRKELASESLCLVMGADAALQFKHWKRADEFAALSHILLVNRPGSESRDYLPDFIDLGYEQIEKMSELKEYAAGKLLCLSLNPIDVSSSQIRESIANRKCIDSMVTDAVQGYICDNSLYQI